MITSFIYSLLLAFVPKIMVILPCCFASSASFSLGIEAVVWLRVKEDTSLIRIKYVLWLAAIRYWRQLVHPILHCFLINAVSFAAHTLVRYSASSLEAKQPAIGCDKPLNSQWKCKFVGCLPHHTFYVDITSKGLLKPGQRLRPAVSGLPTWYALHSLKRPWHVFQFRTACWQLRSM